MRPSLGSPNLTALVALNERFSTKLKLNKKQINLGSRAKNKHNFLVRAPFINSWAVFNKRCRNVVATSSQRRRRSSQVVAGRRNVGAIKNGSSDLIIKPRTAILDFGLFIFCWKILVVWRLKQNHPRLSGWGNLMKVFVTHRP